MKFSLIYAVVTTKWVRMVKSTSELMIQPLQELPGQKERDRVNTFIEREAKDTREHVIHSAFISCDTLSRESACMLPVSDPGYEPPTKAQVAVMVVTYCLLVAPKQS